MAIDDVHTLVAGATICVSRPDGSIDPSTWQGVFHRDVRVLSRFALTFDGGAAPLLSAERDGSSGARAVHVMARDAYASPTALLLRHRRVGTEVREQLEVRAYDGAVHEGTITIALSADFAPLLPLKHTVDAPHPVPLEPDGDRLSAADGRAAVEITVEAAAAELGTDTLRLRYSARPGHPWSATVVIRPTFDGQPAAPRPAPASVSLRVVTTTTAWTQGVTSALADLDGLRVIVPSMDLSYLGAGAPWFMALFGRDTLLTAWQSLITGPDVALDVLRALAAHQGTKQDARTREEPGRILHELRTGGSEVFGLPAGTPYYGTVDATPLFVMLLGELHRWGAPTDELKALLPAARAAVDWCVRYGDVDGDGFVEYAADPDGLENQGWKDSGDSMVHADGTLAGSPIALAEVQAYTHAAYLALAALETAFGDPAEAAGLRDRAATLRAAFVARFWLPDCGLVAMALDGDKRPLAVASSNMGHCLWAGLLDDATGQDVAARLVADDLTTSWGVRTLGSAERAYNPLSYHLGSIWPHDSAIVAAGLARYGHAEGARAVTAGLLAAAEAFGWRLPELLAGFDAGDVPHPVTYPVACSPQAWSAAVPLLLLRTALRLDPDVPAGRVHVAPILADDVTVAVHGIPLAGGHLSVRARGTDVEVLGVPAGITVDRAPRGASVP